MALPALWADSRVIFAIGGPRPEDSGVEWLRFAQRDAWLFCASLRVELCQRMVEKQMESPSAPLYERHDFRDSEDRVLLFAGAAANRQEILEALNRLEGEVDSTTDFYLFVSADGRAAHPVKEGFLLMSGGSRQKWKETALPLSLLFGHRAFSNVRRLFVFADVSRQSPIDGEYPAGWSGRDNRINKRFESRYLSGGGLAPSAGGRYWGVLSSRPNQASEEDPDLGGGHGVFTWFLSRRFAEHVGFAPVGLLDVVQDVAGAVRGYTLNPPPAQEPSAVGAKADVEIELPQPRRIAAHGNLLLASTDAAAYMASLQAEPPQPRPSAADELRAAIAATPYTGFEALAETVDRLAIAADVEACRPGAEHREIASLLEQAGRRIVAAYGLADEFPDDPRKLRQADFSAGARLLSLAERAYGCAGDSAPRPQLEAMRLFCEGRAMIPDQMDIRGDGGSSCDDAVAARLYDKDPAIQRLADSADLADSLPGFDLPEAHNALGIAWLLNGCQARAREEFEAAMALAPDWIYPRHNLAQTYVETGEYEAARLQYGEAIERARYLPYLYFNLALVEERTGELQQAERRLGEALSVFDRQIARYRRRVSIAAQEGRQALREHIEQTIDVLLRNRAEADNMLGALYLRRGRPEVALDPLGRALAQRELPAALHNLGLAYRELAGELGPTFREAAVAVWRWNGLRHPEFPPSRVKLADEELAAGRPTQALREYRAICSDEEALDSIKRNSEACLGVARAMRASGLLDEAAAFVRQLEESGFANAATAAELGRALKEDDDPCAAEKAFRKAVERASISVFGDRRSALKRELRSSGAACRERRAGV